MKVALILLLAAQAQLLRPRAVFDGGTLHAGWLVLVSTGRLLPRSRERVRDEVEILLHLHQRVA